MTFRFPRNQRAPARSEATTALAQSQTDRSSATDGFPSTRLSSVTDGFTHPHTPPLSLRRYVVAGPDGWRGNLTGSRRRCGRCRSAACP